ncbi:MULTISPECIES: hypothetical protein [Phyllobacteriaceae]|jgi:hypothetical protein|uniref:hypothetical protein n=1 Tax=unclassified Mesorhizobium TaxID=325217 RepID=UPI0011125FD6|nr:MULTISPECIES: hypothetical protein [unclassified Mesorhizobium]MBN9235169.1 hypothetical protein [Mesorhizobium sp.]
MADARTFPCPHCTGVLFIGHNDVFQHIKARHGKKAARQYRARHDEPREPSLGVQLSEALVAAARGEPVPEHIEAMFPKYLAEARRGLR